MEKDPELYPETTTDTEVPRKLGRRSVMPKLDLTEPLGLGTLNSYELPDGTVYYVDAAPVPK
jgi:hypothetical protein